MATQRGVIPLQSLKLGDKFTVEFTTLSVTDRYVHAKAEGSISCNTFGIGNGVVGTYDRPIQVGDKVRDVSTQKVREILAISGETVWVRGNEETFGVIRTIKDLVLLDNNP